MVRVVLLSPMSQINFPSKVEMTVAVASVIYDS